MPTQSKVTKQSKAPQTAPSKSSPDTPPSSPAHVISTIPIVADQLERITNLLERLVESKSDTGEKSTSAEPQVKGNTQPAEAKTPASKLEFKTVDEVYVAFSIATASLTFCLAVGIRVLRSIRSWSWRRQKRRRTITNMCSLFVLELVS
jgi:hypothetical protein